MKDRAPWIAAVAVLVVVFGTIYGVVQQAQRNAADMPQIQLAQDEAANLNAGGPPNKLNLNPVDIGQSLAPFIIVYDKKGYVVSTSGYLAGKQPEVPLGMLQAAHGQDFNRVTWGPANDVRVAVVVVEANNYYVLSGRNLKQVERNEAETFKLSFIGGLLSLAVLASLFKVLYNKP